MTGRSQKAVKISEMMEIDYDELTPAPSRDARMLTPPPHPWNRLSASILESQLERNVIDVILSFLTLTNYAQLIRTSKFLRAAVYGSSHLFAEHCGGRSRIRFSRTRQQTTTTTRTASHVAAATEIKSSQTRIPTLPDDMKELLDRFPYLKTINLHELAPAGDDLIRVLNESRSANQYTSVLLHGLALSYWCPHTLQLENVKHLTLSGHSIRVRVSSLIQPLKLLKSLTLKQCPGVRDEDILDIGRMSQHTLEELTLNHVKIVKPVASFPVLKRASFVGCFGLKDLSGLCAPRLIQMNLSFCVRLSGEQIQNLVEQLPALETLIMMKCNGVRTLVVVSTSLRRLDATFTHNLKVLRLVCPNLHLLEVSR
jgi:hypothetical protein